MPIRPPKAKDFRCDDCGHQFKQSLWRRLLSHVNSNRIKIPRPCPKCGSRNVGMIIY